MDDNTRNRSRSPRRDRPRERKQGGFRWKDKGARADRDDRDDRKTLKRGYRQRSRSPRRDRQEDDRPRRSPPPSTRDRDRPEGSGAAKDGEDAPPKKKKKAPKPAAPPAAGQEMIIVHVNDRLGTKAAIPCMPSDPIKMFKIMVAARIGREPHEILLKRQGERPFKDQLTLEDYGVGNGVQLDLEVDTGE